MEQHELRMERSGETMSRVGDKEGKTKAWAGFERAIAGHDGKGQVGEKEGKINK